MQRRWRDRAAGIPWATAILGAIVVLGGVALLAGKAVQQDRRASRADPDAAKWLARYWRTPIPPQGTAPAGYLETAKGLRVENCSPCHPLQAQDWKQSIHGGTMGPGILAQLPAMSEADRADCFTCHAPLSEQWPRLQDGQGRWLPNATHQAQLSHEGLVCAACHLRSHVRHGPLLAAGKPGISQHFHGEPGRTPFFSASEFCKTCHQHGSDRQAPNGKPVENTYAEWLASPYAAQGKTCQSCHMPDRRHLWKGIHDPEMTRSGVTIATDVQPFALQANRKVTAALTVRNTGTGHAFPTYTTPAVYLRAAFTDDQGRPLPGETVAEHVLQRRLDMSREPWGETLDSRLMPDEASTLRLQRPVPAAARALRLWVVVDPDQFYAQFYRERLAEQPDPASAALYRRALSQALATPYVLFDRRIPVAAAP